MLKCNNTFSNLIISTLLYSRSTLTIVAVLMAATAILISAALVVGGTLAATSAFAYQKRATLFLQKELVRLA
jgi:hypothetical protein